MDYWYWRASFPHCQWVTPNSKTVISVYPFLIPATRTWKLCKSGFPKSIFFRRAAVTVWLLKSLPRIEIRLVLQPENARPMRSLQFFSSHHRSTNQRPDSGKAGVILERESMWQWRYELMMDNGMTVAWKWASAYQPGVALTLFVTACHDSLHAEAEMNLVTSLLRIHRNQSPGLSSSPHGF